MTPITVRTVYRAVEGQRRLAPPRDGLQTEPLVPTRYVLIPDPLIAGFAHDPSAKSAVPLAARDLIACMGSDRDADRAAIMRRIVKLGEDGWLCIERTAAAKHRLLPTWGRTQSGTARPWRFDAADSGRPSHLRGRRLPIALLANYLVRLDPRPSHGRALISRYFTRPLLDLVDIGVYTIGLRAEVTPTPRLRHLELHNPVGMFPPPDSQLLLSLAAVGALTTLDGDAVVPVLLSIQGYARLGNLVPRAIHSDDLSQIAPALAACVVEGHRALNPQRQFSLANGANCWPSRTRMRQTNCSSSRRGRVGPRSSDPTALRPPTITPVPRRRRVMCTGHQRH